jgi:hypothetical protein
MQNNNFFNKFNMKLKNNSGRLNTGQIALKSKKNIKNNNYLLLDTNRV